MFADARLGAMAEMQREYAKTKERKKYSPVVVVAVRAKVEKRKKTLSMLSTSRVRIFQNQAVELRRIGKTRLQTLCRTGFSTFSSARENGSVEIQVGSVECRFLPSNRAVKDRQRFKERRRSPRFAQGSEGLRKARGQGWCLTVRLTRCLTPYMTGCGRSTDPGAEFAAD